MTKVLKVKCPRCKESFEYYSSEFRPFCSDKCKMIDLGQWLTENYRVPSQKPLDEVDLETVIRNMEPEESDEE
ncbi:MAG: DNA gyrase inhibitor YacG [Bdellovibrio sp. CG12_big_fil_rev_8_21_14_0_65_39_13]|nr:MAG: DNA gyrase inhibitor YacG [Bdellovibrio sp. CG22_combo_CG10-13_8_21_14_all_39_27]PIQ58473.1 MAG: DNA gyrase inhibitor YacG [Bdellovibrio sp. CG12_big_fil_rev_8_21_14_0_65_39_13]PIR35424.1 MAG: DNA gyrase inhibitor YacG [Bdellovibrio sp. CG11_big_fil_rev_8_21_14_0_20_39_38]PJB53276.1 MAG: DNA gyrase inhibitor YacG [Bdellovibrio sp. CG_4_9_14_3_um_filter_39_7]